jgi:tellurite resistance protein
MSQFAIVMGLGGLALSWRKAHAVFDVPSAVGESLMLLAVLAYLLVAVVQAARLVRYPHAHAAEFRDPKRANFVPAFTVASAIIAGGLAPYAEPVARVVWVTAAGLHIVFAFVIVRRWFTAQRKEEEASPAWFIPVVGTLLMPVVGVPLGFTGASWFFFAVGALFWLILAPVMTHRLFFADPLPDRASPSLFILLAPPAVGGLAALALNEGGASPVTHALFGFAAFISLLVTSLLGGILSTRFSVTWWALTFPSAAFATLAVAYAGLLPALPLRVAAFVALAFATVVVAGVAVMTVRAIARGDFVEVPAK